MLVKNGVLTNINWAWGYGLKKQKNRFCQHVITDHKQGNVLCIQNDKSSIEDTGETVRVLYLNHTLFSISY